MKYVLYCVCALGICLPLWARAAQAPPEQAVDYSKADERFKSMDTGNKGQVTFEDFQKRYPNMQRPAFDSIDSNKDGLISLEEWRNFFQNHGAMGGTMPPGHGAMGAMPPGHEGMGAMPPGHEGMGTMTPGHDTGGQMQAPAHGAGTGDKPLILPPAK